MEFTRSLRFNYEYGRVYRRGKYLPGRYCVLHYLKNGKDINRLGITTAKNLKGSVVRNRIRRLMKESYRLNEIGLERGYDIVLLGRHYKGELSFSLIEKDVLSLLSRAGILAAKTDDAKAMRKKEV